jgi:nitrous oxidase accessory protein NosD
MRSRRVGHPRPSRRFTFAVAPAVAALVVAALVAAALLAPSHAEARRIFVPKTQKTIQAAIDAAAPGDTLWISKGVYHGPFVLKKKLYFFAPAGPESTFLDGGDSLRVLHVEGVNGGGLIGFGIRRGKAVSTAFATRSSPSTTARCRRIGSRGSPSGNASP